MKWIRKCSLYFYLLVEMFDNWCDFLLKCLVKCTSAVICTWCIFFGKLLISNSISLLDIGYPGYLFLLVWVLVIFVFQEIGHFHLSYQKFVSIVLFLPLVFLFKKYLTIDCSPLTLYKSGWNGNKERKFLR